MKLYELIELGSTLTPETDTFRGCALAAAAIAINVNVLDETGTMIYRRLREYLHNDALHVECPARPAYSRLSVCAYSLNIDLPRVHPYGNRLLWTVEHLHLHHKWTRQRIAEWLKPIEDAWEAEHKTAEVTTAEAVNV